MKRGNIIHGMDGVVSLAWLAYCIKSNTTFNNEANLLTYPVQYTITRFKLSASASAAILQRRLNPNASYKQCHTADKSLNFVILSHLIPDLIAGLVDVFPDATDWVIKSLNKLPTR